MRLLSSWPGCTPLKTLSVWSNPRPTDPLPCMASGRRSSMARIAIPPNGRAGSAAAADTDDERRRKRVWLNQQRSAAVWKCTRRTLSHLGAATERRGEEPSVAMNDRFWGVCGVCGVYGVRGGLAARNSVFNIMGNSIIAYLRLAMPIVLHSRSPKCLLPRFG